LRKILGGIAARIFGNLLRLASVGGHQHSHGVVTAAALNRKRLLLVLGITSLVLILEVIGAAVTGSLALLADAGHMLTDVAGITLAVLAVTFAARPATAERTFGYYRLEILAAVVNAVLLLGVAAFVMWEAVQRWQDEPAVNGWLMLVFALIGLVANTVSLLVLRSGASQSLNVRGAYLEVLGDFLGSVAVIVAALVIALTDWVRADAVASLLVGLMILPRTWSLLREAVDVLLEATPRGIDVEAVRAHLRQTPGVSGVHDLHIWTITSGLPVLSAHVVVDADVLADGGGGRILDRLGDCLADHFDVEHCTFQLEPVGHAEHEFRSHA
jgi:cobalt-zinc-cadmium efflux system protein